MEVIQYEETEIKNNFVYTKKKSVDKLYLNVYHGQKDEICITILNNDDKYVLPISLLEKIPYFETYLKSNFYKNESEIILNFAPTAFRSILSNVIINETHLTKKYYIINDKSTEDEKIYLFDFLGLQDLYNFSMKINIIDIKYSWKDINDCFNNQTVNNKILHILNIKIASVNGSNFKFLKKYPIIFEWYLTSDYFYHEPIWIKLEILEYFFRL